MRGGASRAKSGRRNADAERGGLLGRGETASGVSAGLPTGGGNEDEPDGDEEFINSHLRQQQAFRDVQDGHLDELHASAARLGAVSMSIRDELHHQNKLIAEINEEVDVAQSTLDRATSRTNEFIRRHGGWGYCCVIFALCVILFILVLVVVTG